MQSRITVGGVSLALLLCAVAVGPAPTPAEAQERALPLAPPSPTNRLIAPFMEGWYRNDDGTYTISFGYRNMNTENVFNIPVGERNAIEPSEYDGMQPTVFLTGRHRGVFGVRIPAELAENEESIWWRITNANGEVTETPGRTTAHSYELDYGVRPQGSEHPLVWFDSEDDAVKGVGGIVADATYTVGVGSPLTLELNTRDPSERDPEDPRFREPVPVRVVWFPHQGPGEVEFTRHENHPLEEEAEEDEDDDDGGGFQPSPPGPDEITLDQGYGTASVIASFSEPGEYMLRARVDNWSASDSSSGDQCCWTNAFVRVTVTP